MELIETKVKGETYLLPNCYPSEVKGDKLEFFIYGKGWLKTKKFKFVDGVNLPDRYAELTWLQIAELYNKYGIEVADQYARKKTAGIVSRQTARGYGKILKAIEPVLFEGFDPAFFDLLRCEYMMSCFGLYMLDIIALDNTFAAKDADYNAIACTYKGKECTMNGYVLQRYGENYVKIIEAANEVLQ